MQTLEQEQKATIIFPGAFHSYKKNKIITHDFKQL